MNFIGKPALQRQKEQGLMKQLVFFQLNDIDPDVDIWPWGGEPLYRNNEYVGTVTSAGYGFNADKLICVGYIHQPKSSKNKIVTADYLLDKKAKYQVDIAGNRFTATPYLHAPTVGNFNLQHNKYRPTALKN